MTGPAESSAQALRNQKRSALLALGMVVAAMWISIPMGEWRVGVFVSVGIVLSFVNHALAELSLLRSVESGDEITKRQYAVTSLVRLMAVSVVAITLAVVFWPDGAAVLVGLALFHLITLVFVGIPLLKEIKKA
ncbi:MAG TPA: hypothetical protein VH419_04470 [Nocardioidaceae bacterium]